MAGYHQFSLELPATDGFIDRILVLFKAFGTFYPHKLDASIASCLNERLPPDHLVVIVANTDFNGACAAFKESPLDLAKDRSPSMRSVVVASYDHTGTIAQIKEIRGKHAAVKKRLNDNLEKFVAAGLEALAITNARTPVLIQAPSGFVFDKPSSASSNYFIRAENALSGLEEISFIAFALLRSYNNFIDRHKAVPEVIYVDSMSIVSVALTLRQMHNELHPANTPSVLSFHSYEGLRAVEFETPTPGTAFVVISASTSCNLAQEWVHKTSCDPNDTITLFSYKSSTASLPVMHTLVKPQDCETLTSQATADRGYKLIKIVGEHFLSQFAKTRAVNIVIAHTPIGFWSNAQFLIQNSLLSCHKGTLTNRTTREIHVDGMKLLSASKFLEWFLIRVAEADAATVSVIVHQDDSASLGMANKAKDELGRLGNANALLLCETQLSNYQGKFLGCVIVVGAVVSRGSGLLSISRDLRDLHPVGPRVFLGGIGTFSSIADQKRLEANLKHAPPLSKYSIDFFLGAVTGGSRVDNSWTAEKRLIENCLRKRPQNSILQTRLDRLKDANNGLGDDLFWPSSCTDKPMTLRAGFAFWEGNGGGSGADVFFTMSCLLQCARESDKLNPSLRLDSAEFQHVVIAPQNFERYNDGIIQAALLRAATASELDYSGERELSQAMTDLLIKVVSAYKRERGEAAHEFLIALASKRLRLAVEDVKRFRETMLSMQATQTQPPSIFNELLDEICLPSTDSKH